ncbi:MAG: mechanosensitive ion channel family protein, partial [Chloroflexota bacterium]|nr:mechanosensitive ion channel family protein [Chloroflexota bacterium]
MNLSRPLDALEDLVARLIGSLTEYLPSLLAGILLLLAGWVLARLLQAWSTRLIGGGLAWLTRNDRVRHTMARLGLPQAAPTFIGTVVFWAVLLLFLTAAAEVLGLNVLSLLLSGFATYLPSAFSAVLVLFAGLLAGNLVRGLVIEVASSAGLSYAVLLGRTAQIAVILVAAVTGAS